MWPNCAALSPTYSFLSQAACSKSARTFNFCEEDPMIITHYFKKWVLVFNIFHFVLFLLEVRKTTILLSYQAVRNGHFLNKLREPNIFFMSKWFVVPGPRVATKVIVVIVGRANRGQQCTLKAIANLCRGYLPIFLSTWKYLPIFLSTIVVKCCSKMLVKSKSTNKCYQLL